MEYYEKVVSDWPDYEYAGIAQCLVGDYLQKLMNAGGLSSTEAWPKIEQAYLAVIENYSASLSAPDACLKMARIRRNKGQVTQAIWFYEQFLGLAKPTDPRIESVKSKLTELKGEEAEE